MELQNTFKDVVKKLNELDVNDKGKKFEEICLQILKKSSFFSNDVNDAWLWKDFPYRNNEPDTGIDIVVKDYNNQYWSVQCKCYSETHVITKTSIDSFLARSSKGVIIRDEDDNTIIEKIGFSKLLIFTTSNIEKSKHLSDYENLTFFNLDNLEKLNIDWDSVLKDINNTNIKVKNFQKKHLLEYQQEALGKVIEGFKSFDRGKLIMACGSGKTFTSLKIVEEFIKTNNISQANILYFVPSIPLLSQTIMEWKNEIDISNIKAGVNTYAICSDSTAAKKEKSFKSNYYDEDVTIPISATTNAKKLIDEVVRNNEHKRHNFFFCLYQSINVIINLQNELNINFDLVLCDEAHRTFGVKIEGKNKDSSNAKKVHENKYIKAKKRLYMTATPKIYSQNAIKDINEKIKNNEYHIYSMDDESVFGPIFYRLSFGEAISKGILTDYRIIALTVNKNRLLKSHILKDENIDDASKIWALLTGLSKNDKSQLAISAENPFILDPSPSLKAVVFTNTISQAVNVANVINKTNLDEYYGKNKFIENNYIVPEARHIKGSDSSYEKSEKLNWLKNDDELIKSNYKIARILTNARCLTEGVDVPALDAIAFLERKTSQIDIIQACGRVMRKSKKLIGNGEYTQKKYGYIIVPIITNSDVLTDEQMNNNEDYKLLLKVLAALRSHDERLDNDLNRYPGVGEISANFCIINSYVPELKYNEELKEFIDLSSDKYKISSDEFKEQEGAYDLFLFKYVGNREYSEVLSQDIGNIVSDINKKINEELEASEDIRSLFEDFVLGLKAVINPKVDLKNSITMLSQHIVLAPILNLLFNENEFLKNNPVYELMENMFNKLNFLSKSTEKLSRSYYSIEKYLISIKKDETARQNFIKSLFEKFFKYVDNKTSSKNGVVYTPVEVVDFMINTVEDILNKEFNESLRDKGLKILDPFTGTGTFITRLLNKFQELNMSFEEIKSKYLEDVWCNEIMLVAYYISLINIEYAFKLITNVSIPFNNCIWADTFKLNNSLTYKQISLELNNFELLNDISKKENKQNISVVIGNPPYNTSNDDKNDYSNKDMYEDIYNRVLKTYSSDMKDNTKTMRLHDSYVYAYRWATDRIKDKGVVAFITNGGFIENKSFNGFRRELLKDFDKVYVYDLLGKISKYGKTDSKNGDNIFGAGSTRRICITFLVKNNGKDKENFIHYYKIEDSLKTNEKLDKIKEYKSLFNVPNPIKIVPDSNYKWIDLGSNDWENHISICVPKLNNKSSKGLSYFKDYYSWGIVTTNDLFRLNFSLETVKELDDYTIKNYNILRRNFNAIKEDERPNLKEYLLSIDFSKKMPLIDNLRKALIKNEEIEAKKDYRLINVAPFVLKYIDLDNKLNHSLCKFKSNIFPNKDDKNIIINILFTSGSEFFTALATKNITSLHFLTPQSQAFPLYWYKNNESVNFSQTSIDKSLSNNISYAISDEILNEFRFKYKDNNVSHEDIFNYTYGVFHSKEYKDKYKKDLMYDTPKIPYLDNFYKYAEIGKDLINLHINYEDVPPFKEVEIYFKGNLITTIDNLNKEDCKVTKISLDKDNSKIIFNNNITIENVPNSIYEYKLCNKSAIEIVISKYIYNTNSDYEVKIIDDPNEYDQVNGGKYILKLILSLITLSLKTNELINQLPEYKEI